MGCPFRSRLLYKVASISRLETPLNLILHHQLTLFFLCCPKQMHFRTIKHKAYCHIFLLESLHPLDQCDPRTPTIPSQSLFLRRFPLTWDTLSMKQVPQNGSDPIINPSFILKRINIFIQFIPSHQHHVLGGGFIKGIGNICSDKWGFYSLYTL